MPSTSKKQHNFMAAIAHSPSFAKKVGISQSVGSDFIKADKGHKFAKGGDMAESKAFEKKEFNFFKKKGAPKSMLKQEKADAGMKKGGCTKMAAGGVIGGKMLPAPKNVNRIGGDLPGSKHFGRSVGEGIEKDYKAQTKTIKHRQGDGVAKRGLTKIGRSKEM